LPKTGYTRPVQACEEIITAISNSLFAMRRGCGFILQVYVYKQNDFGALPR